MLFNYKYSGSSGVTSTANKVGISFAPDTLRPPTFFVGQLHKHLPFREAMSALHAIVVSDLRYQPKNRDAYLAWVKTQEDIWIAEKMKEEVEVSAKVAIIQNELTALRTQKNEVMQPFYKAQRKLREYAWKKDRELSMVLDPVITVHPDELFFECFSKDESSYGKLGCNYNVFKEINDFECGTTNIDYSYALYNEFQKIRTYKNTEFKIDPSGFEVQTTGEDTYKEVKIDLPESWVRGFLQVSSAMTLSAVNFDLHPMDIHNFLFLLKSNKAKIGPRSIRFHLAPGKPVKVIFEPWNKTLICKRSIYKGDKSEEIRIWGRRRLLTLERLIPLAKRFKVTLLGTGLPSFFVADLGDLNFTLGLSGWTANDWSKMGNFDLLAPRRDVSTNAKKKVFKALKQVWLATPEDLAKKIKLKLSVVKGALQLLVQAGKVVYDLNSNCYRLRELSNEELPLKQLRFANEREEKARQLVNDGKAKISVNILTDTGTKLEGGVQGSSAYEKVTLEINKDQGIAQATCSCRFFKENKLRQGPCEHILAVRMRSRQNN